MTPKQTREMAQGLMTTEIELTFTQEQKLILQSIVAS
jgi:hypothetical protein